MRFRITALATLIVVVVLVVTGIALVLLQRRALTSAIDDSLLQRADDLEAVLRAGELPERLGLGADETFVQVVAADGSILATSENVAGIELNLRLPEGAEVLSSADVPQVDDDPFRLLTRRIPVPGGTTTLLVGGTLDDVKDSAAALARALMVAIPLAAALLAGIVWWLVGRALSPVEAIRREVAAISGGELHRRVPEPATADEIGRLAATMNRMLDRIEESTRRQQRFVADASHELRNPLTRIKSEVEVDLAHPERADLAATHRSVAEEVEGLGRMLEDLLYLARSDAGDLDRSATSVDVSELLEQEVARLGDARVPVTVSAAPVTTVGGRADQLARAIRNLLDNAVRHASAGVASSVAVADGAVRLVVEDDGPGIPAPDRERVFERFARVDEARSAATGGTGLGLAIVRDIVERHGGRVFVDPRHTDGTRFVVELPVSGDIPG